MYDVRILLIEFMQKANNRSIYNTELQIFKKTFC